ncbi:MAG: hypothetical protein JNK49_08835 [Planctomycetes bacterium]|nr:hypothetical protein [Planctomycetota bacterium]
MQAWLQTCLLGAGFGAAFLVGQRVPVAAPALAGAPAADASAAPAVPAYLAAQGRGGPINPPPAPTPTTGTPAPEAAMVYPDDGGQAVAGHGFLAVTGSYGIGTSVLYLVDTERRQLAVYEARGGAGAQRRIVLVGARKIDLDLQLEGYNDQSEYDYSSLRELFRKRGRKDQEPRTGLENPGSSGK